MTSTSHKGFRFNFMLALEDLASCEDRLRSNLEHFYQLKNWSVQDRQRLLQTLAQLILDEDLVPSVVKFFKPLLLEVLERAAKRVLEDRRNNPSVNEQFCYILSTLLPMSHLKDFIYNFTRTSSLLSILSHDDGKTSSTNERILLVVKTAHNLLSYNFHTFHTMLDWDPVFNLVQHPHPEVRWRAVLVVSLLTEMSDQMRLTLINKHFGSEETNKFLISDCLRKGALKSPQECWNGSTNTYLVQTPNVMVLDKEYPCGSFITHEDLTGSYTAICGVLLPRLSKTVDLLGNSLILVPSTINNLQSLALSVASGSGVLLQGPVGSGKTALVEYLARATGRFTSPDFMKIQLGDQTDSKSLLGTYVCTDTPGEFVWQAGTLLQAVQEGRWILLEDIDLAPMDVVSVLIPLLESSALSVPAHGNVVKAAPGFQLFATQRLYNCPDGSAHQVISSSSILDKLWTQVQVEPLTKQELEEVLWSKYPDFKSVASKLVDIYCLLSADPKLVPVQDTGKSSIPHNKRLSSTRDFMKWCRRIALATCGGSSLFDAEDLFLEAQDCFSSLIPKTKDRLTLDMALGSKLGLSQDKIEFFFKNYKPRIHLSHLSMTVGRVSLKRKVQDRLSLQKGLPKFAYTKHALVLLERVASSIRNNEPVLLVGETGTGKTSTVQYLATQCGITLNVVNMSQQSDSSDLLGGFKPVEMKQLVFPVREKFEVLFCNSFSRKQNVRFLSHVQQCFAKGQWEILFKLMIHCQKSALDRLQKGAHSNHLVLEWQELSQRIQQLRKQHKNAENALAFRFMEGTLVQAIQRGEWVLLDEINLAMPETLECLNGLLESSLGSVVLMERGDVKPVIRHDDFRLFACMNPATDVGKKDLPPGIRNRFTEIFVSELEDTGDLETLVVDYLQGLSPNAAIVDGMVRFYLTARRNAGDKLTDGTGHKPHYSMRTLCRALRYASANPHGNTLRSIYEGFCLSFLTQLDRSSHPTVQALIKQCLLGHVNATSLLKQPLPMPQDPGQFFNFEGFWVAMGNKEPEESPEYVLTDSVKANLKDLCRVVSARNLPVLIQGETSVGKTSLIQWLAKSSGNHCVRINNHEHTDIQEYMGCYTSDESGKLVFRVLENLSILGLALSGVEGLLMNLPVLIQGETSVGKTSLIQWLAKSSGNHCVRINNHEHTDIQEYMGCYTSDESGKLVFREGVLIDAMRKGHWIILDELNLAPSDVLEALNRLLDDNRELFIPETQETVTAHSMFMLFATQNPPGHYGGRKILSRAFRNRFVELHFDELPSNELEVILHQRCSIPLSYAKKLVAIMLDLQAYRSSANVFAGKQGFIMLRDLFRWAERYRKVPNIQGRSFHDWDQYLAEDGYMLLVGRCRNPRECKVIQEVIERNMKRKIDPELLFGDPSLQELSPAVSKLLMEVTATVPDSFRHIVWTRSMRRLAVLAGRALQFGEPVLLVGETGCGKTTICELFAALCNQKLHSVNCHMHSESADFLGGLRPVRNREQDNQDEQVPKLFEWCDGPLVQAMKEGAMFLVDEISLADDSVLERLNSVLEPERTLVLAEKGDSGGSEVAVLVAHNAFKIVATMNPGGDFGKKELSPALRNRFTEVWCLPTESRKDFIQIIEHNLKPGIVLHSPQEGSSGVAHAMMDFIEWFHSTDFGKRFVVSIRDLLSWVHFINACSSSVPCSSEDDESEGRVLLSPAVAYVHGACLVFLDALGSGVRSFSPPSSSLSSSSTAQKEAYQECFEFLTRQVNNEHETDTFYGFYDAQSREDLFGVDPFFIKRGPLPPANLETNYALNSPTTCLNAKRILRALQLPRPILLEGSPGVGKTSLVGAIAKASQHRLIRINLSEQTDVADLFGSDLPVEGGEAGQFVWRDGPLLKALKAGHWIVLDELNLASQSVLEGLNACLDHRAEVYIPELGMTFKVQPDKTRLFACQNPLHQGGGRKGLPKSFLNRFTQVYVEPLSKADLLFITQVLYPQIDPEVLNKMVTFNMKIHQETVVDGQWGQKGGPWELNLRDVFRWCDLIIKHQSPSFWNPGQFVGLIYCDRMRTLQDKRMVLNVFKTVFLENSVQVGCIPNSERPFFWITPTSIQVGHSWLLRHLSTNYSTTISRPLHVLHRCLPSMESLMKCLEMNWMSILIGPRSSGKTSLVHLVAQLTGNRLEVMAMNSAMDTTELLGGFEQADLDRHWMEVLRNGQSLFLSVLRELLLSESDRDYSYLVEACHLYRMWSSCSRPNQTVLENEDVSEKVERVTTEKLTALEQTIQAARQICETSNITTTNADAVLGMLHSLRLKLKANGNSAHCGGKFEWVDGQLVEALKCGYWLLIDNVNFCNPSVLDRLNALLEPGGILTVDERGVIDGEIPFIKPHPGFRLILAMDPKYGEISRAMRNRGVEIFMFGEEDEEYDDYDVQMMLHGLGLDNYKACDLLVAFHREFKKSLDGSLLDVLHAACLSKELIQRGSEIMPAVINALKQVYVRNQMSEHRKQLADNLINQNISGIATLERERRSGIVVDLPSVQSHVSNCIVSMIQLHFLPVMQVLLHDVSSIQFAVLLFLERSSLHDWKLRLDYLTSMVEPYLAQPASKCSQDVAVCLKSFIRSFDTMFNSCLMDDIRMDLQNMRSSRFGFQMLGHEPFDLRMNTDLFKTLSQDLTSVQLEKYSSLVNRLLLLEMIVRRSFSEEKSLCMESPFKGPQTKHIIQLSHAFHSGQLSAESLPHPVVVHLWPFFKLLGSYLEHCVCQVGPLSNMRLGKVIDGLLWRDRLWRACERQSQEHISMSVLSLHWCWVVQNTLSIVPASLGELDHSQLPGELVTVVNQLSTTLGTDRLQAKVYIKILEAYGHPPPFKSDACYLFWERLCDLCRRVGLQSHHQSEDVIARKALLYNGETVRRELTKVTKVMLASRMVSQTDWCLKQFDVMLTRLEETISRMETNARDVAETSEGHLELQVLNGEHAIVKGWMSLQLSRLFDDLCTWQESSVLGSLMMCLAGKRSTVENVGLLREQLEALTNFQMNSASTCPETLACYQHLYAEACEVGNQEGKLCHVIQCMESELLCNLFMAKKQGFGLYGGLQELFSKDVKRMGSGVFRLLGGAQRFLESVPCKYKKPAKDVVCRPLSAISIGEYHENVKQLEGLAKHFWVNGDYVNSCNDLARTADIQLFASKFSHAIQSMKVLLSVSDQQIVAGVVRNFLEAVHNTESLNELSSAADAMKTVVLSVSEGYRKATKDEKESMLICTLLTEALDEVVSLGGVQLQSEDPVTKAESTTRCGSMWVKVGLALSLILSPVGPVDPVERNSIELQYVTEEIQTIENELEARFFAEEIWTGLKTRRSDWEALLTQESSSRTHLTSNPHRVQWLLTKLKELRTQAEELFKSSAHRPARSQFEAILDEVRHFMSSIGNAETVLPLVTSLVQLVSQLGSALNEGNMTCVQHSTVKTVLHKEQVWCKSAERLVRHLSKEYPLYCDLLIPFVAAVSQVIYGLSLVSSSLSTLYQRLSFGASFGGLEEVYEFKAPEKILQSLCGFPFLGSLSCLDVATSLVSPSTQHFIQVLSRWISDDNKTEGSTARLMYRILRSALLHIQRHSSQHGYINSQIHSTLNSVLAIVLEKWKLAKEQEKQREEEEESLFKFRNKSHGSNVSEDDENKKAVTEAFPNYEAEFRDVLAPPELDENVEIRVTSGQEGPTSDSQLFIMNVADFSEMRQIHEDVFSHVQYCPDFISVEEERFPNGPLDSQYLESFQWGYQTAAIISGVVPWEVPSSNLSTSHLLQSCIMRGYLPLAAHDKTGTNRSVGGPTGKPCSQINVYHDSSIEEVMKVRPVLLGFMGRVQGLLLEWPEHPALMQLLVVMDRILSFPVTSPLMKILTGLEVLLRKAQDWESNAAKHVSLKEHLDNITHLIIQWRKMELKCWSSLLDVATLEASNRANQWWCYMYNLLDQFRAASRNQQPDERISSVIELIEPLQRFIESSTMGEFVSRVQMLQAFYREMCYEDKDANNVEVKVSDMLWNIHSYYSQFIPCVENSLQEKRTPVEKDLKDFVRIAKWSDSNFWAMKQAADKSHHTLHKFVRRYKSCLNEPVHKIFLDVKTTLTSTEEEKKQSQLRKTLRSDWFISPIHLKMYCEASLELVSKSETTEVVFPASHGRLTKRFTKMRQLAEKILNQRQYMLLVTSLDDFTGDVIVGSGELQALNVSSQRQEKRAEMRKHIQQRKRKALSDLFKMLASLGLSYRKGLGLERHSAGKEAMLLAAVNEESVTRSLMVLPDRSPDLVYEVRQLLQSCRYYYNRSLARSVALSSAMVTPSNELSVGDVDRCKGCSYHLLHVCYEQRKVIATFSRHFSLASGCLRQLTLALSSPTENINSSHKSLPPQKLLRKRTVGVMALLTTAAQTLQQMCLLIRCCPTAVVLEESTPFPRTLLSPLAASSVTDPVVGDVRRTLESCLHEVQKLAAVIRPYAAAFEYGLHDGSNGENTKPLASWSLFRIVGEVVDKVKNVAEVMGSVLPHFASKSCPKDKGLGGPLVCLKERILLECEDFEIWRARVFLGRESPQALGKESDDERVLASVNSFIRDVDSLNISLLLAVQRLVQLADKETSKPDQENQDRFEDKTDSDFNGDTYKLQDGHLTTILHKNLLDEITSLNLADVSCKISCLVMQLRDMADNAEESSSEETEPGLRVPQSYTHLCAQFLGGTVPLLHQYLNISQSLLVTLLSTHRATSKLLSVLLNIFTDLASRGFCLPPEIEEGGGEGCTEFEDVEGGGVGEGEGMKDVSDQIDNEDQVEDTQQEGQEPEKKDDTQQQIPDEENGLEMSENFDGALHDVDAEERPESEGSEEGEEDEPDLDKQMGEVDGQDTEKLDEKMWGDSEDEENEEEQEMKEERGSGVEAEAQSQMVAKDDNKGATDDSKSKADESPCEEEEEGDSNSTDFQGNDEETMSDEEEDETNVDASQQGAPDTEEPENLDLPDDLQLDEVGDEQAEDESEPADGKGAADKEKKMKFDEKPEDMEAEEGEREVDAREPEEESTVPHDEQTNGNEEEEEEVPRNEDNKEGNGGDEEESPQEEDTMAESGEENWRTGQHTQPQDGVQAVEDSGKDEGRGERAELADETAGQAEPSEGTEERGVGRADAADSDGHSGESRQSSLQSTADSTKQSRQRKQMNRARSDRSLGSMDETIHKRLKTVDQMEQQCGLEVNDRRSEDLFQHMRDQDQSAHDAQTLDSATADQAHEQEKAAFPEMFSDKEDEDEDSEMSPAWPEEKEEPPMPEKRQHSRLPPRSKPKMTAENEADGGEQEPSTRVEDGITTEMNSDRYQSTFHSSQMSLAFEKMGITSLDAEKLRADLEHQLSEWGNLDRGTAEEQQVALEAWHKYGLLTSSLSQELCEQLRLVLEPSLATKLKGDYRSGKRLNMRKVIPYIASQFRKDKIWLRRTKPSKRQYQIMLAVDDSSSMNDNHSKQLAFESLAVISNALSKVEAGDFAVCSFGEAVRLLHPFHEPFTDLSGARILHQFTFDQKKTKIAQLLDTCTSLMVSAHSGMRVPSWTRNETSQLLLIVSDGRGIFLEGMEKVQKAVRVAREINIFMVFVILDNPTNKDSVLDIRVPIFRPDKPPEIKSYMEQFPFPYYIILRDINALPQTLSDALRQWFELVSSLE